MLKTRKSLKWEINWIILWIYWQFKKELLKEKKENIMKNQFISKLQINWHSKMTNFFKI